MDFYQPEYNICKVAGRTSGRVNSELQKQKVKEANSIEIIQFDIDGNFIKEWKSISECNKMLKGKTQNLYRALENFTLTFKGFRFKYKHIKEPRILKSLIKQPSKKQLINPRWKPVYKICPETLEVLKEYNSINNAGEDNNINPTNISIAIRRKGKSRGFIWKYKNSNDNYNKKE